MIRLYIEDQELDITEGFSHQITYAVDDLQNLDSKATAFSKTIILPGTSKNNYLLGNIFEFANANFTGNGTNVGYNFNASKSAKCRLEINGLQIIKGVLRLLEIVRDGDSIEYEIAIFGELGGFVSKLGNKKLTDLDFSNYNHTYTVANIVNRWDDKPNMLIGYIDTDTVLYDNKCDFFYYNDLTTIIFPGDSLTVKRLSNGNTFGPLTITNVVYNGAGKNTITVASNWTSPPNVSFFGQLILNDKGGCGVYYPLIDYGTYSTDKISYKYRTFRPALFVREYLHKIITGAGYTYESKFFETDFFKRLIIPHNESILNTLKQNLFGGSFYGWYYSTLYVNQYVPFNELYGDLFTTTDNLSHTYTGQNTTVKITGSINIEAYLLSDNFLSTISIQKNGINLVTYEMRASGKYSFNYYTFNIDINTTLNTNDIITVTTITAIGFVAFGYAGRGFLGSIFVDSLYPVVSKVNLNDTINISQTIPKNILQKDFFASILKMFYLMVTEDKFKDKHLKIEPYTWFYNLNSDSYLDWTYKLDRSQPIRIKPMSEANARYYDIKFKADTDYYNDFYKKRYNEGYGDVRYDNELEFAKDASTTEVIFSSTPLLGYNNVDKIVPTIMKWDGATIGTNEENVNSNIRIMQCKNITEITSWNILNDSGNIISAYTAYPYAGHFDDPDAPNSDLNFGATKELFFSLQAGALGNNLFNTYYSSYLAEITDKDSRLVTAKFKLNDTDIFNLDFGRFIFLDGVLYRLSRIVDYTPGEICTVELLRVIYTTYDSTVNASDDPEVVINGRTWKAKNLDTEYYQNGDQIPQITDDTEWADATEGAWCYYEHNTANGIEYGKLYNWYAIVDNRGLAPAGWDLPTEQDLIDLADYTNGSNELKEVGTAHWNQGTGTDEFGFKALGAGRRRNTGPFDQLKTYTYYWTREEYDTDQAYYGRIQDTSDTFSTNKLDKNYGFSVRLIKDV